MDEKTEFYKEIIKWIKECVLIKHIMYILWYLNKQRRENNE